MSAKQPRAETPVQMVTGQCGYCRHTIKLTLRHYEVVRCACGHESWALQPTRGGPLVLFPHPQIHRENSAIC